VGPLNTGEDFTADVNQFQQPPVTVTVPQTPDPMRAKFDALAKDLAAPTELGKLQVNLPPVYRDELVATTSSAATATPLQPTPPQLPDPAIGTSAAAAAKGPQQQTPPQFRLHEAVRKQDVQAVRHHVDDGARPVHLDAVGQSPLDLLDSMNIDAGMRLALRSELLRSQNPSAPPGYVKPEAFHGSPWALEILLSGELKRGVNDPTGGTQALEGQVFFSDRTPLSDGDAHTRVDLRKKARTYGKGLGVKEATPYSRGAQYRVAVVMQDCIAKDRPLDMSGPQTTIKAASQAEAQLLLADRLQKTLHAAAESFSRTKFPKASTEQLAAALHLPRSVVFEIDGQEPANFSGEPLRGILKSAADTVIESLEGGKAPFLAVINDGAVVPVTFGFEKVQGLKSHTVAGLGVLPAKKFSYKSENHPLQDSPHGGKLKEIEVQSLKDLATLMLGSIAKGATIATDSVVRIKAPGAKPPPATYLDSDQLQAFKSRLLEEAAKQTGAPTAQALDAVKNAPVSQLRTLNTHLRNLQLNDFIPPRT